MSRQYNDSVFGIPDFTTYSGNDIFQYDGKDFRRIEGYSGYYINSDGEVLSVRKSKPFYMSTYANQYGHRYVDLSQFGVKNKCLVHRLVAEAFVPNPNGYPVVRHINDDPEDNRYVNLEWGTQKDNMQDCRDRGRDYHKSVYCFELDRIFRSCADAADFLGVTRAEVTRACRGEVYAIKGHHLCYLEDKKERESDRKWLRKCGNNKSVVAINVNTGAVLRYGSRKEAANDIGISDSGISNVLAGRIKQTRGWRFEEGE